MKRLQPASSIQTHYKEIKRGNKKVILFNLASSLDVLLHEQNQHQFTAPVIPYKYLIFCPFFAHFYPSKGQTCLPNGLITTSPILNEFEEIS